MCGGPLSADPSAFDRVEAVRWALGAISRTGLGAAVDAWRSALRGPKPNVDLAEAVGDAIAAAHRTPEAVACYAAIARHLANDGIGDRSVLSVRKALAVIDGAARRGETEDAAAALELLLGVEGPPPVPKLSETIGEADPPAPPPPPLLARLVAVTEKRTPGEVFGIHTDETRIGRADGEVRFPSDLHISSRHARIVHRDDRFFLSDAGSRNGTFIRIRHEAELCSGDIIRIGRQLLRFDSDETLSYLQSGSARLTLVRESEGAGGSFPIRLHETTIGSAHGDIRFPQDPRVSDFHARIVNREGTHYIVDDDSEDGTFVKLHDEVELTSGDEMLVGYQRLRFETN
jgi:pSer/pThr/pTyr-binding forkhead associated (FHA) protein